MVRKFRLDAEVEARGLHRKRLCASLYTYCIYELRFSEDAAARRSSAARLVKQFPPLFDAIAHGQLHLTGLLMLGPHLTPENHVEVLGRAKFRTKKEIAKLVRELNPLPHVPDLIEAMSTHTAGDAARHATCTVRSRRGQCRLEPHLEVRRSQRAGGRRGLPSRAHREQARAGKTRVTGRSS